MNRALLFTILSGLSFSCTNYTDNISMTAEHPVLPILTMKEANPVFKIELIRHQTGDNYSLQKLEVDLHGTTDIDDIESVGLYHTIIRKTKNQDFKNEKSKKTANDLLIAFIV